MWRVLQEAKRLFIIESWAYYAFVDKSENLPHAVERAIELSHQAYKYEFQVKYQIHRFVFIQLIFPRR